MAAIRRRKRLLVEIYVTPVGQWEASFAVVFADEVVRKIVDPYHTERMATIAASCSSCRRRLSLCVDYSGAYAGPSYSRNRSGPSRCRRFVADRGWPARRGSAGMDEWPSAAVVPAVASLLRLALDGDLHIALARWTSRLDHARPTLALDPSPFTGVRSSKRGLAAYIVAGFMVGPRSARAPDTVDGEFAALGFPAATPHSARSPRPGASRRTSGAGGPGRLPREPGAVRSADGSAGKCPAG